jgi:hypothetical protein
MIVHPRQRSAALLRLVTGGLLATIDSHLAGRLPLHRFAWELRTRIDTLAAFDPPCRTLTRLRWLQRAVERLDAGLTEAGRAELTGDEKRYLGAALADLCTVLGTLCPVDPTDPSGTGPTERTRVPAALHTVA